MIGDLRYLFQPYDALILSDVATLYCAGVPLVPVQCWIVPGLGELWVQQPVRCCSLKCVSYQCCCC